MDIEAEGEGEDQICSFMWADNFWIVSHSEKQLEQMLKDLIEEAAEVDLEPKPATSTFASEEKEEMILGTSKGCYKLLFKGKRATLWKKECSWQIRPSGRTSKYTRARMFRGEYNVKDWWIMCVPFSLLEVKLGRGHSRQLKK